MPKVSRSKFKKHSRSKTSGYGVEFSQWRKTKDKSTYGYIHPRIGIWYYFQHGGIPFVNEYMDRKTEKMVRKIKLKRMNCACADIDNIPNDKCPMCRLEEFAGDQIDNGVDDAEIILLQKDRSANESKTLYQLSGGSGYLDDMSAKTQVAMIWIPLDPVGQRSGPKVSDRIELINGSKAFGNAIVDMIDVEIEDYGEVDGDIEIPANSKLVESSDGELCVEHEDGTIEEWKPYPVQFNQGKTDGFVNYQSKRIDSDIAPIDDSVQEVMMADDGDIGFDIKKFCKPTLAGEQLLVIRDAWVSTDVEFSDFIEFGGWDESIIDDAINARKKAGKKKVEKEEKKKKIKGRKVEKEEKKKKIKGSKVEKEEKKKKIKGSKVEKEEKKVKKKKVLCDECGTKMFPNSDHRCDECGSKYDEDIPF